MTLPEHITKNKKQYNQNIGNTQVTLILLLPPGPIIHLQSPRLLRVQFLQTVHHYLYVEFGDPAP